jgi:hypothetical protein
MLCITTIIEITFSKKNMIIKLIQLFIRHSISP